MKLLWCWRCKMEIPMLDDTEFAIAKQLYSIGFRNIKKGSREDRFQALLEYYETITGYKETEPNVIMHHQISQYGEACENCGKPYRTPLAKLCMACGNKKQLISV